MNRIHYVVDRSLEFFVGFCTILLVFLALGRFWVDTRLGGFLAGRRNCPSLFFAGRCGQRLAYY